MWWEYIKASLLIVVIIAAAYFVTRYVAAKGKGFRAGQSRIRILGAHTLGRDKQLVLAEIAGKVYVLGVTAQRIERIDTLSAEDLHADGGDGETPPPRNFSTELLERLRGAPREP